MKHPRNQSVFMPPSYRGEPEPSASTDNLVFEGFTRDEEHWNRVIEEIELQRECYAQ